MRATSSTLEIARFCSMAASISTKESVAATSSSEATARMDDARFSRAAFNKGRMMLPCTGMRSFAVSDAAV